MTYLPKVKVTLTKECICENTTVRKRKITTGDDAVALFRESLLEADRERLVCLHLDCKMSVIAFEVVSIGSVSASVVHPREIFKAAILLNASSIILMHNHPSGSSEPSAEDIEITGRIAEAGRMLGIELLDHVIVAAEGHTSFRQVGLM